MKNKLTKKCHYISRVYLKEWSNNNNHLNVYDKLVKKELENGMSIENNFYERNLYSFTFDLFSYSKIFKKIDNDLRKNINNFQLENNIIIYYKNKKYNYNKDNLGKLLEKDNISFYRKNKKVSNKELKELYKKLSSMKSNYIEEKLSEKIENNWKIIIDSINNKINNTNHNNIIELNKHEDLTIRLMLTTMILRIKNTPGNPTIGNTINSIIDGIFCFLSNNFDITPLTNIINKDQIKRLDFLKMIYDVVSGNDFAKIMYPNNEIPLNFELYYINDDCEYEFYTSDNPCFVVINNFEIKNDNNGIYFPITPKMVLIAKKADTLNREIICFEVNKEKIDYINNMIYTHTKKYIIFKNKFKNY